MSKQNKPLRYPLAVLYKDVFFNFFSNSNKNIKISKNKKIKWANKTNLYGTPLRFSIKTCSLIFFQIVIKILKFHFLKIKKNTCTRNKQNKPLRYPLAVLYWDICSLISFQIVIQIHCIKISKNKKTINKQTYMVPLTVLY